MTPAKASFRPNLTRPPRLENSLGRAGADINLPTIPDETVENDPRRTMRR